MSMEEDTMKTLSIIVPCYNEEENIRYFYDELMKTEVFFRENQVELDINYIDDGSCDRTVENIQRLH